MVYLDSRIFAALLSISVGATEAAIAKIVSMAYLAAGMPAVGIAIRLGFSGKSPWRAQHRKRENSMRGGPQQSVVPAALLALFVYCALSAVRTVDTFIAATVDRPITWTTEGVTHNRTFDLGALAGLPVNWTVTPTMGAAIYQGFAPPFDSTGKEWFALAASIGNVSAAPVPPLSLTEVKRSIDHDDGGYAFTRGLIIRDLRVPTTRKVDKVVVLAYGYGGKLSNPEDDADRDAARTVWIPYDLAPGDRSYAFIHLAPVIRYFADTVNMTAMRVDVSHAVANPLPNSTDLSDSVCIAHGRFITPELKINQTLAVITPAANGDPSAHTLTVDPYFFFLTLGISAYNFSVDPYIDDAPLGLRDTHATLCYSTNTTAGSNTVTLGNVLTEFRAPPLTLATRASAVYVSGPAETGSHIAEDFLLDVDPWLAGPVARPAAAAAAPVGRVDYVQHNGDLANPSAAFLAGLAALLVASTAFVLAPALVCENLAYSGAADVRAGMAAGWTWDALRRAVGHVVVRRRPCAERWDVLEKDDDDGGGGGGGPGAAEPGYVIKTVPKEEGESLVRVVAGAKRAGVVL